MDTSTATQEKRRPGRLPNDGRGRLGGRAKGTPNRPPLSFRSWLSGLVDSQRSQFEEDLQQCSPQVRAEIVAQLIAVNAQPTTPTTAE